MSFGTQLKKRKFFQNCASDSYELKCISNHTVGNATTTKKKHSERCWLVKLTHTRVGS